MLAYFLSSQKYGCHTDYLASPKEGGEARQSGVLLLAKPLWQAKQRISDSNGCDYANQISFKLITLNHSVNSLNRNILLLTLLIKYLFYDSSKI